MTEETKDRELEAVNTIVQTLRALSLPEQHRVLASVTKLLGLSTDQAWVVQQPPAQEPCGPGWVYEPSTTTDHTNIKFDDEMP